MTKEEMIELKSVVRRTMEEEMEMYSEVWLNGEELCKHFNFMTPSWLKRYRQSLPHREPKVTDEKGDTHSMAWQYPKNQIQRMFASGEIENLKCKAVVTS